MMNIMFILRNKIYLRKEIFTSWRTAYSIPIPIVTHEQKKIEFFGDINHPFYLRIPRMMCIYIEETAEIIALGQKRVKV